MALTQALNYGEKGVEWLFEVLEKESNLDIYWSAYQILEDFSKEVDQPVQNNTEKQNLSWWDKLRGKTQLEKTNNDLLSDSPKQKIRKRLRNYFHYDFETVKVNLQGDIIERIPGKARYFRQDLGQGIYLDMTYIPGGSFMMGAPESEIDSRDNERPQHRVTVPPFLMGKYTVTQEQYQVVMGNNPSHFKDNPRNPVEQVSWHDAQAFCQKLEKITGKGFRLPTEAEWEYACRAGTSTPFYCGETISTDLANYYGNDIYGQDKKGVYRNTTTPVGSFSANPWGLYDMAGNLWEWCADSWHDDYRDKPDSIKNNNSIIWLNSDELRRVSRGGSWFNNPRDCRSADRHWAIPGLHYYRIGFRVVCRFPS